MYLKSKAMSKIHGGFVSDICLNCDLLCSDDCRTSCVVQCSNSCSQMCSVECQSICFLTAGPVVF